MSAKGTEDYWDESAATSVGHIKETEMPSIVNSGSVSCPLNRTEPLDHIVDESSDTMNASVRGKGHRSVESRMELS